MWGFGGTPPTSLDLFWFPQKPLGRGLAADSEENEDQSGQAAHPAEQHAGPGRSHGTSWRRRSPCTTEYAQELWRKWSNFSDERFWMTKFGEQDIWSCLRVYSQRMHRGASWFQSSSQQSGLRPVLLGGRRVHGGPWCKGLYPSLSIWADSLASAGSCGRKRLNFRRSRKNPTGDLRALRLGAGARASAYGPFEPFASFRGGRG